MSAGPDTAGRGLAAIRREVAAVRLLKQYAHAPWHRHDRSNALLLRYGLRRSLRFGYDLSNDTVPPLQTNEARTVTGPTKRRKRWYKRPGRGPSPSAAPPTLTGQRRRTCRLDATTGAGAVSVPRVQTLTTRGRMFRLPVPARRSTIRAICHKSERPGSNRRSRGPKPRGLPLSYAQIRVQLSDRQNRCHRTKVAGAGVEHGLSAPEGGVLSALPLGTDRSDSARATLAPLNEPAIISMIQPVLFPSTRRPSGGTRTRVSLPCGGGFARSPTPDISRHQNRSGGSRTHYFRAAERPAAQPLAIAPLVVRSRRVLHDLPRHEQH